MGFTILNLLEHIDSFDQMKRYRPSVYAVTANLNKKNENYLYRSSKFTVKKQLSQNKKVGLLRKSYQTVYRCFGAEQRRRRSRMRLAFAALFFFFRLAFSRSPLVLSPFCELQNNALKFFCDEMRAQVAICSIAAYRREWKNATK